MNNVFDIFNSRSLIPPGFKKALCEKNVTPTENFINNAIDYISQLRFFDGELLINSKRKTGFLGLIISLKSALALYNDLIMDQKNLLYLPLYKVSRDHLDLMFSSLRAKRGWNNNPTSWQFTAVYKRLLVRAEIRDGGLGNCIALDSIRF
ncbi:unnamed protein product [Ceutorhynchus assimilis]|uniref:Transposable element P transposase-like RNase H C-terminal domain-containing protein n=1 Tax=Ceutorhynchus assimilis TaxID=467358 RepID=A0A9N9QSX8_9CUCU|nr:unnamed protein product [Ceutorhynchus assimilis]